MVKNKKYSAPVSFEKIPLLAILELTEDTRIFPNAMVSNQNDMIVLFMEAGACVYAYSSPV